MTPTTADVPLDPGTVPLLFVCGLHRSGTSALARLLGSSPTICAMSGTGVPEDEGQHLQRVLPAAYAHGGPGIFAFDPGAHLTERSQLATRLNAAALLDAWGPHWHLTDDETSGWSPPGITLLEKSPPNLVRTRLLQSLFPQARFVIVLRHPAVVAVSTARWRPQVSLATLLRHWVVAHRYLVADLPRLRYAAVVRYEDLVVDPDETLRRLDQRLRLSGPYDTGALEPGLNERHLAEWRTRSAEVWGAERRSVQREITRFGYDLESAYVHDVQEGSGWQGRHPPQCSTPSSPTHHRNPPG